MTTTIESGADILDVRDIIARVEELREERETFSERCDIAEPNTKFWTEAHKDLQVWDEGNEGCELKAITELLSDLCGYGGDEQWEGDWYPVTLIHENYFTQYAQELADDIGAVDRDAKWPNTHIDWEAAAEDLKQDYSTVEFDGNTYYYR